MDHVGVSAGDVPLWPFECRSTAGGDDHTPRFFFLGVANHDISVEGPSYDAYESLVRGSF